MQCVLKNHIKYMHANLLDNLKANAYLFLVVSVPHSLHEMVIAAVSVQLGHPCYHLCDKKKIV